MKNKLKFIVPIICVVVVIITFYMIFDIRNKVEEKNYDVNTVEIDDMNYIEEPIVLENTVEDDENNNTVEENVTTENTSKNNDVETNTVSTNTSENSGTASSIYESDSDAGSTDRKEEAIALVKEKWGEDDTVNFRCDSVTSDGEYIVAVISKSSAIVKNYFKVNLENKTVNVDY